MIPANARILTCPHCGETKKVVQLLSGNTFGGTCWSDGYVSCHMLPTPSPLQRCQSCGEFYFMEDQEFRQADDYSSETGDLNYEDITAAFEKMDIGQLPPDKEKTVRTLALWAYNSHFARKNKGKHLPTEADQTFFKENAHRLIALMKRMPPSDIILAAELYRECGLFEEAGAVLMKYHKRLIRHMYGSCAQIIEEHINRKDSEVFAFR